MADSINPNIIRKKRKLRTAADYLSGLARGDRFILSEVLTIIENNQVDTHIIRDEILASITVNDAAHSLRIGITGSPGAGKSTLIEQLGLHYISEGHKVAVLAIDPSSIRTEGSILGDKTRMPLLSTDTNAYIRPTASATHLGGVSKTTQESIAVCEKAGYDVVIVESVGVGQSEVELAELVDVYGLVLLPGGGDDIQGIKRGVVEMADFIVINKADQERIQLAKQSRRDFQGSVALFPHELEGWTPPVLIASALEGHGIDAIAVTIAEFVGKGKAQGYYEQRRAAQEANYLKNRIHQTIANQVQLIYDKMKKADEMALQVEDHRSIFAKIQLIVSQIQSKLEE